MSNQTENRMNILSGVCAAPIIDGIYSFCESKETIIDLYAVLHTLYENGLSSEAYQILRVFCAVLPISDYQDLPPLAANEMNLNIREMLPNERDYAYTQSYQLMSQSGCITLMRGDFGNGGKTFYPDYEDQIKQYRTDEFAAEFDSVIKEFYKVGILADRDSMLEYCCARPDGRFMGDFSREYGYRVDTEKYTYLLRCIPAPGDNNFYCYAYVSGLLNAHMEKAAQGIRFIDSHYNDLFRLPDGGNIIVTHTDGEQIKMYCRFIDEYHTEIGKNTFHICEFAERMEDCGATYAPADPPMPEMCYSTLPSSGEVIRVFRGEHSYIPLKMPIDSAAARKYADNMNRRLGVSKAQEAAMLAGSMFGWSVPIPTFMTYSESTRV